MKDIFKHAISIVVADIKLFFNLHIALSRQSVAPFRFIKHQVKAEMK